MRAMSALGSTKSESHRKTHRVEPDGAGRKFMHLTWGGPDPEREQGVSRGRSSEDSRRKPEGAKGQRIKRVRSTEEPDERGKEDVEKARGQQQR